MNKKYDNSLMCKKVNNIEHNFSLTNTRISASINHIIIYPHIKVDLRGKKTLNHVQGYLQKFSTHSGLF